MNTNEILKMVEEMTDRGNVKYNRDFCKEYLGNPGALNQYTFDVEESEYFEVTVFFDGEECDKLYFTGEELENIYW